MIITAHAYARAGIVGNPSDGYFGKTIACIVRNFCATVTLWDFPPHARAAAGALAEAQLREPGTAVFRDGAKVAAVRVGNDRPAARRLLDEIDPPRPR